MRSKQYTFCYEFTFQISYFMECLSSTSYLTIGTIYWHQIEIYSSINCNNRPPFGKWNTRRKEQLCLQTEIFLRLNIYGQYTNIKNSHEHSLDVCPYTGIIHGNYHTYNSINRCEYKEQNPHTPCKLFS